MLKKPCLNLLLEILPFFQINIEAIFENMQTFLMKKKPNKNFSEKEFFVALLLLALLKDFQRLKLSLLCYHTFWYKTINLIQLFGKSSQDEIFPVLLKIFFVIKTHSESFYIYSDKTLKKDVKEFVGKLFETICDNVLKYDKTCISVSFPEFDQNEVKVHELCLVYMIKYAYDVAYFACIGDLGFCDLFISNSCLSLLFGLPSAIVGKDLATKFILNALQLTNLKVAEKIKKEILDLINSEYFFGIASDCIEDWARVIKTLSDTCFSEKSGLVLEIQKNYSKG